MTAVAPLVPELIVTDIARSRAFYEGVLGFSVMWERPNEGFVYLGREGAEIMLDLVSGQTDERGFLMGPLDFPCGRGVGLQIRASDVDALHHRVVGAGGRITLAMEEKWYCAGQRELGNRQLIVADPDGYLLRFFQDLGERQTA